jgi:hypothetical protein
MGRRRTCGRRRAVITAAFSPARISGNDSRIRARAASSRHEAVVQLGGPLHAQRGRHDDQRVNRAAALFELGRDQAGLNRLAVPDASAMRSRRLPESTAASGSSWCGQTSTREVSMVAGSHARARSRQEGEPRAVDAPASTPGPHAGARSRGRSRRGGGRSAASLADHSPCCATTVVEIPPRGVKAPVMRMRLGLQAATRSSRMRLTAAS